MKLPILSRLRGAGSGGEVAGKADGERYTLSAEIPGLRPGKPLWRINLELHSEPQGDDPAPQVDLIVQRLMERASITADSVAGEIFDAVRDKRFLVLVNADDKRQVLLKRVSPEYYFRMVQKGTAKFMEKRK